MSFTSEKSSEKDTDPNAPKFSDHLRRNQSSLQLWIPVLKRQRPPAATIADTVPNQTPEQVVRKDTPLVPQQVLNPANTGTPLPPPAPSAQPDLQHPQPPIALAPVVTLGAGMSQISRSRKTPPPSTLVHKTLRRGGKSNLKPKPSTNSCDSSSRQRGPALAEKLVGSAVLDEIGIGEVLTVGFTVQTVYDIYQEWNSSFSLPRPHATVTPSRSHPTVPSHPQ